MEKALKLITQLVGEARPKARQQVILALTKLIHSLETPDAMVQRIGGLVLQTSATVTAVDLGLFRLLAAAEGPVTVDSLAQKTSAEKPLLRRLLRFLAAIGMVDEVSKDTFAANHASRNMTAKVAEAGIKHYFYTVCPEYYALPDYLKNTGYKNPSDETHTAWHDAFKTDKGPFTWFSDHPDNMAYFNDYMASRRGPELSWLSVYPVRQEAANWSAGRPLYVNIGGNIGHQCAEFREKYPDIPGRVILLDLAHSIAAALPTPGVENMVHNFFEPQPVKGAKFYFLRGVCHNHPDHKVRQILEHTKAAMTSESVLLIDEIIPPEVGASLDATAHDMTMLAAFAGAERSEAQWKALFAEVGLRLVKTYLYNAPSYESVMDVRLA